MDLFPKKAKYVDRLKEMYRLGRLDRENVLAKKMRNRRIRTMGGVVPAEDPSVTVPGLPDSPGEVKPYWEEP